MCVCVWGFRAHQHLRSLAPVMNDYGELWWPNDIQGSSGPKTSWHLPYMWGKSPKKPHPGNLSRPGIEPGPAAWQACILLPAPQRWTINVINKYYLYSLFLFFHIIFIIIFKIIIINLISFSLLSGSLVLDKSLHLDYFMSLPSFPDI